MSKPAFAEVSELTSLQPTFRTLIRAAFEQRLGAVAVDFDFHRGWNGGWKCRATVRGKPPLEFALLRTSDDALLALPVPFPRGWRARGVGDSLGRAWTCDNVSDPRRLVPNPPSPVDRIDHRATE